MVQRGSELCTTCGAGPCHAERLCKKRCFHLQPTEAMSVEDLVGSLNSCLGAIVSGKAQSVGCI